MATAPGTSGAAVLGRVFWMLLGPALLLVLTVVIISQWSGWVTGTDVAYFIILGLMVLGRWLEFRSGTPLTATGEPATPAHLRRFIIGVLVGGTAVWVAANLLGQQGAAA
jgi:hypothetical protein